LPIFSDDLRLLPSKLYLVDLYGKPYALGSSDGGYALYSIDDVDRALGAVRLHADLNHLVLVARDAGKDIEVQSSIQLQLVEQNSNHVLSEAKLAAKQVPGFQVVFATVDFSKAEPAESDAQRRPLILRLSQKGNLAEWPVIVTS
jgi:hypothetical protein